MFSSQKKPAGGAALPGGIVAGSRWRPYAKYAAHAPHWKPWCAQRRSAAWQVLPKCGAIVRPSSSLEHLPADTLRGSSVWMSSTSKSRSASWSRYSYGSLYRSWG